MTGYMYVQMCSRVNGEREGGRGTVSSRSIESAKDVGIEVTISTDMDALVR